MSLVATSAIPLIVLAGMAYSSILTKVFVQTQQSYLKAGG